MYIGAEVPQSETRPYRAVLVGRKKWGQIESGIACRRRGGQARIEARRTGIDEERFGRNGRPKRVGVIRSAVDEIVVPEAVSEHEISIEDDVAAMGVPGVESEAAVLVNNIVFDVHAAHRHPEDDAALAVIGHHVVVHFHVADRRVAGDVQAVGGIAEQDIIDHPLVVATQVQSVIEIATGAAVVVNGVRHVDVIPSALVGIDAILPIGAGAGGVAVVMDFVVEDLVEVAIDGNAAMGASPDFKPINDMVAAVQIDPRVAIRAVEPVNDRPAPDLRPQGDGTGGRPALVQVQAPVAGVIGIDAGKNRDRVTGNRQAVGADDRPDRLGRGAGVGVVALRGHLVFGRRHAAQTQG